MKKYCLFALAILMMTGCAENNTNSDNSEPGSPTCGNGSREATEVCDTQLDVPCSAVDSTKTWKEGGKALCNNCESIDLGTCEEMPNLCSTVDAACKAGDTKPCAEYDSTKNWNAGGNAVCASDCSSFVIGTCVETTCGNQIKDPHEACDISLAYNCNALDLNIKWELGGAPVCKSDCSALEPGTCKEATNDDTPTEPVTKCGTDEAKCAPNDDLTCDQYDNSKKWQEGGKAECSDDCSAIEIGSCKEAADDDTPTEPVTKCGTDEAKCAPNDNLTCAQYDNSKKWQTDGKAACSADCSAIEIGSCKEVECSNDTDCTNNKICIDGACVNAPICGNGILDDGETCEFEGSKACKEVDPKWLSGNAQCNDCVLDESNCIANETLTGLAFCQLVNPVSITFTPSSKSESTKVKYIIGSDVTESNMQAELVYGTDFRTMNKWQTISATQNADDDSFTATLTESNVLSTGGTTAYYTFRIKTDDNAAWKYCKRNNPDEYNDADIIQADLNSPYELESEGSISSNIHETGTAVVSNLNTSNIIAEFNFNDPTKATGNTPTYTADVGNGVFSAESNAWCNGSECFVSGLTGKSISLKNWKSTYDNTVEDGTLKAAHISITGMSTTGATGINLDMQIRRNATESPNKIKILYNTGDDNYTELSDLSLNTDSTNVQKFVKYNYELPASVNNHTTFNLFLVPYGGAGLLRFDDVIISKGN